MDLLHILFVAPFVDMWGSPVFFAEVVITGLLTGVMYSLVALGFVQQQQKRVELCRALAMEPDLLLLDEPMAGMNVEEKEDMCRYILDLNEEFGTTIVLIEHDMGVVMDISERVVVLDYGRKIADGTPEEVRADQHVIDAYLGVPHDDDGDADKISAGMATQAVGT